VDNKITVTEAGTWTITGIFTVDEHEFEDTATLTVEPAEAVDFWIEPEEADIIVGESQEYTAWAEDKYGNKFEVTDETTWSDDAGDASSWVDNEITVEEEGEWTITGEYENETETLSDTATLTVEVEPPEPAYYQVEIIEYDDEVEEGEDVKIEYKVTNIGELEGKQNIVLFINGDQEDVHRDIVLEPGHSDWGKFIWTSEEPGEYELEVYSDDEQETRTVKVLQQANFEVEITDYQESVTIEEETTIEYRVINTGEVRDTQNIAFYVNGKQEDALLDLTLDPGESHTGEFTWRADVEEEELGDYELEVASRDTSDSVTVTVEEKEIPGFTTILLILGLVMAVAIYYKKEQQKNRGSEPQKTLLF